MVYSQLYRSVAVLRAQCKPGSVITCFEAIFFILSIMMPDCIRCAVLPAGDLRRAELMTLARHISFGGGKLTFYPAGGAAASKISILL